MSKPIIDKFATAGLFVTAIFSPCCFPLYGFALSALGLGSVELFGGYAWYVFQGLVALALSGQFWSYYSRHKNIFPLLIALISSALIFGSYYFYFSQPIIYSGMFGLLIATVVNHFAKRQAKSCPNCVTNADNQVQLD